jgi:hypothetical protein
MISVYMKVTYSLYEISLTLFYFFCYRNSLYITTYPTSVYAKILKIINAHSSGLYFDFPWLNFLPPFRHFNIACRSTLRIWKR